MCRFHIIILSCQKTVSAHLTSKQILPFDFAEQNNVIFASISKYFNLITLRITMITDLLLVRIFYINIYIYF